MERKCQRFCYCVAGQLFEINLHGDNLPTESLSSFEPFRVDGELVTQNFLFSLDADVSEGFRMDVSKLTDFSVDGVDYCVSRISDGGYQYRLAQEKDLSMCSVLESNADFSHVRVFLNGSPFLRRYSFSNFLMMSYAFSSASKGVLLMHASVMMYGGRGYLFLGKSGTGKSTHSRLWIENISDTELLNDDNPVVRFEDGTVVVYGSPWSGKTPCYKNKSVPVGAFVRLSQKSENKINKCGNVLAYASLTPSVSNMMWDDRVNDGVCSSLSAIATLCPVYALGCLPNREAAFLCHDTVVR